MEHLCSEEGITSCEIENILTYILLEEYSIVLVVFCWFHFELKRHPDKKNATVLDYFEPDMRSELVFPPVGCLT